MRRRWSATRAVAHWAWRMFRRDWRGQSLVLVLLTVAVAVSSYGAAFGHALAPSDRATFGSANARIRFTTSDAGVAAGVVSAARSRLGTVEEITDTLVPIPGSVQRLDLRYQNPRGVYGAATLRLRSGRYPANGDEIALTSAVSQFLAAPVGGSVTVGGATRRVVGLVENPTQLDDAFGLLTTAPPGAQVIYTLLVKASTSQLAGFRATHIAAGGLSIETPTYYSRDLGVLLVAALGMILVAVLALTAFLVLAQRRVRQLGMLAAIGATRRQVRNVTVIHGLIVGAIAAIVGTAAAGVSWAVTGSLIALASGRRVSWGSVPLWLILSPGLMGVFASAIAAWWPARTMARMPIVRALSDRPPDPTHGRRPVVAVAAALAVGVLCLRLAHQRNALLMIIGLAAMIAALLLTTPLVIRLVTARSGKLPVTGRLAWRELGRNQSRSAAALATVTIAVGISTAAVVITAANSHPSTTGNLSDRQVLISAADSRDNRVMPPRTTSQTTALDQAAAQVAATLPNATLVPLNIAVDPAAPPSAQAQASGGLDAAQAVQQHGRQLTSYPVYVASPQLLATLGFNAQQGNANGYYAIDPSGTWTLLYSQRQALPAPAALHAHRYTALPQVLASPAVVAAQHWTVVHAGWLLQTPQPVSPEQQRAARTRAAAVGLAIQTRDPQTYLGRLRLMFTVGGIIITLGVIAIALFLLRIQTTRDQRILTAVGAPRRARRQIAATTATVLAALGALLGITGAYITLLLAYSDTLNRLSNIPWTALTTIGLGIPVLALATARLTAGRQPPSINRPAIE
jgi:putative ABC transport system permease protein